MPPALEAELRGALCRAAAGRPTRASTPTAFAEAYAILAAQRATKILGVFARLADRAGKPGYLQPHPQTA